MPLKKCLCFAVVAIFLVGFSACNKCGSGCVQDEATRAGRSVESFPAADEDYFHDMDQGPGGVIPFGQDEIKGRDMWLVWTGGDDRLWDMMTVNSVGTFDLLKTISSYPGLKAWRGNRWDYLGLVNEPCFKQASGPDPKRFGLWLDTRDPSCPADPFEDEQKYPGVKIGARGSKMADGSVFPVGSYYGYATGIVGLRLFPNPDFDEAAQKKWDPKRYYTDPSYYNDKNLVRPYRVGMSCAFCHVGPNPIKPPADPENPKWENLSSNVGAQYFWVDRIFAWDHNLESFPVQLFQTSRPGTLDTSLVSSDNINNPRTMNAVYGLMPRLDVAKRWGKETLQGGELNNKQFNQYVPSGPLTTFFQPPDTVWAARILKDGSDSVGALGALNRVYLNIGLFSEEWLLHFRALIGGAPITPIEIAVAEKNSIYWKATEAQTPDMAQFFLKSTSPHLLKDAPDGGKYLTKDQKQLEQGKMVFADRCARCHSSKIPEGAPGMDAGGGCTGKSYLDCWNQYWAWTKTDDFKTKMRALVMKPDFLDNNYLSTDIRVPVTLLETNACSPLATNAIGNNIWDNFSSHTYKELPSVGSITWYDPYTGQARNYTLPGGGRGYTRPASLISAWSTAPFLLNNAVGKFNSSPSVAARLDSFNNSIEQMLWPEKREKDELLGDKIPGKIDRTDRQTFLYVPAGYLPDLLKKLLPLNQRLLPAIFGNNGIVIGPIPKGTPIGLLANIDLLGESTGVTDKVAYQQKVVDLLLKMKQDLEKLPPHASDEDASRVFANLVQPLLEVSKCPDFIVNRGHYFGTSYFKEKDEPGLSDQEKRALIEYIKTF